jgi:hypothetical protein
MALTIYGFHDYPHDFAVTKVGAPLEECTFLLDFRRPLERLRWFGFRNSWIGPTVGLFVPIIHRSERTGEFVVGVNRGEPYFVDLPRMWKEHAGQIRSVIDPPIEGLELVADFGRHFPADC